MQEQVKDVNVVGMKSYTEAIEELKGAILSGNNVMWKGKPSTAKSAILESLGRLMKMDIVIIPAPMILATETGNYPYLKSVEQLVKEGMIDPSFKDELAKYNTIIDYAMPLWAVKAKINAKKGKETLVIIEEFLNADEQVKKAFHGIINERRIGNFEIDFFEEDAQGNEIVDVTGSRKRIMKTFFAATGNLGIADGTNTDEMDAATATRFRQFTYEMTSSDWIANWAKYNLIPQIIEFISENPQYYYVFDPKTYQQGTSFPCARTWTMLSKELNYIMVSKHGEDWKNKMADDNVFEQFLSSISKIAPSILYGGSNQTRSYDAVVAFINFMKNRKTISLETLMDGVWIEKASSRKMLTENIAIATSLIQQLTEYQLERWKRIPEAEQEKCMSYLLDKNAQPPMFPNGQYKMNATQGKSIRIFLETLCEANQADLVVNYFKAIGGEIREKVEALTPSIHRFMRNGLADRFKNVKVAQDQHKNKLVVFQGMKPDEVKFEEKFPREKWAYYAQFDFYNEIFKSVDLEYLLLTTDELSMSFIGIKEIVDLNNARANGEISDKTYFTSVHKIKEADPAVNEIMKIQEQAQKTKKK